jgi:hypothetical protein
MFKNRILWVAAAVGFLSAPVQLMSSDLYDYAINVNGTSYCPAGSTNGCSNTGGVSAVPGVSGSYNTSTGLGSLTITFNPGSAGTYYIDGWAWADLAVPFYNEYGATSGSAAAGQSWQIDVPDYESDGNHTGTIIANTLAGTLDNTNHVPGTTNDYNLDCGANGTGAANTSCNDATSLAMGFKFTLTSSQEAIVTFDFSTTNPGGIYLEQIHPVDGNNTAASALYLSGSASIVPVGTPPPPPPPSVPEPASWSLAVLGFASAAFGLRRRVVKK